MNRNALHITGRLLKLATAASIAAAIFAARLPAQEVTFRFAPPDSTCYVENVKDVQSTAFTMGKTRKQNIVVYSKTRCTYSPAPTGFALNVKPLSVNAMRNGAPVLDKDMMTQQVLMRKAVVACDIDSEGRLVSVGGLEDFFTQLARAVAQENPVLASRIPSMVPSLKQGIESSIREEWMDRVGNFVGKTMKVGELWQTTEHFPLYSGEASVKVRTRLVEQLKRDGHDCVRLRFYYAADPKTVMSELKGELSDIGLEFGVTSSKGMPKVVSVDINGTGERIVDPSTMLIYGETQTSTAKLVLSIPGRGKMTFAENIEHIFTYDYTTAAAL